jgi:hypothetical protein
MTDFNAIKEIYDRIKGLSLPTTPLEFLRLIRNNPSIEGSRNSARVFPVYFPGYESLNFLLKDYCNSCNLEETCDWNSNVKHAAGENYPFWLDVWPMVEFSLPRKTHLFSSAETVMCSHYQSNKFEKMGINYLEHPLVRLDEIIKEKIDNPKVKVFQ